MPMLPLVFAAAAAAVYREAARRGREGFPHEQVALERLAAVVGAASRSSQPCEFWLAARDEHRETIATLSGHARDALNALEGHC